MTDMDPYASWHGEQSAAWLYQCIAESEPEPRKKALFIALGSEATAQAAHWANLLTQQRQSLNFVPDRRTRLVGRLVRWLGPARLTHALVAMKVRGMSVYRSGPIERTSAHDDIGEAHREPNRGGSLRAAVFGMNDGLVSNASLILGMAGAGSSNNTLVLTGIAGLLAGAFSMAAGEYISVRSQREMHEYQIALEAAELRAYPEEEAEELALIFAARGMHVDEAKRSAQALLADPQRALDVLAREELGLNPGELGSPWGAASSSFIAFAAGSLIPLCPFLMSTNNYALELSMALSVVALFAVGASLSLFTGRGALVSGLRMLAIGTAAGALTWVIGHLLGVNINA